MTLRAGAALAALGALLMTQALHAQLVLDSGTVAVQVATIPPGMPGEFEFGGVTQGTISSGQEIRVPGLSSGSYTSTQVNAGPGFELISIACDDQQSAGESTGNVASRSADFNLDSGEIVTCLFTNRFSQSGSAGGSGATGGAGSTGGVNPFEQPDAPMEDFPLPNNLPPTAGTFTAPKAGPWDVQNFAGRMSCSGFNMPLAPDRDRGTLEVLDGGATVIGTGLGEGTAPVEMLAIPGIAGRYAGVIGGAQDGIPMTMQVYWQLITDEWISGFLTSTVSQQGMTCNMFRPFELEYAG